MSDDAETDNAATPSTSDRGTVDGEPLHEFYGADPDSFNIDLDDDQDGSGRPGIGIAGAAIQFWAGQRNEEPTVAEAAAAFLMPEEAVAQAVIEHPWMLLVGDRSGPVGALHIGLDGE